MKMFFRRYFSLLICFTLFSSQALAQSGDWKNVGNLSRGDALIVTTQSGARFHGVFVRSTEDSVSLDSDERAFPGRRRALREVQRAEVLEIRRYKPGATALASAGMGAAVGAGLGAGIDAAARSNEDQGLATVVFTLLGALLGWAIGRHTTLIKGERIYVA